MPASKRAASKAPANPKGKAVKADGKAKAKPAPKPAASPEEDAAADASTSGGLLQKTAELLIQSAKGQCSALADVCDNILQKLLESGELKYLDEDSSGPLPYGGMQPFSLEAYKESMTRDRSYSCLVPFRCVGFASWCAFISSRHVGAGVIRCRSQCNESRGLRAQ